jgi:hypothetical protein
MINTESTESVSNAPEVAGQPQDGGFNAVSETTSKDAGVKGGVSALSNNGGKLTDVPAGVEAMPAYQPTFKFKIRDKEKEFDEWIRPVIKDADTEKKVKELYEKAYGLDMVKQDRETVKGELLQAKEKIASTEKAINLVSEYAANKDWDSFFESLNIPKNEILQYALQLVQREKMPPEQKAQWEASRQAQQEARYYQEQNQALQQSQRQFQVQQREFELSQVLSKPDVSVIAEAYNARTGNPSAFREKVVLIGQAHVARGVDISPEQAVQEAVKEIQYFIQNPGQQAGMQGSEAPKVVQPSSKPTLPNIQGRGTSAIKSTVRSLDDLRNLAKSMDTPAY